jgi:hypothetical protein
MLLFVTVPAFGDLVNYSPDALMLHGGPPHVGLGGIASTVNAGWGPWLAWRPSGNGNVDIINMPAPWIGRSTTTELGIYTPPGYDPKESRQYPTLYEAPSSLSSSARVTGPIRTLSVPTRSTGSSGSTHT